MDLRNLDQIQEQEEGEGSSRLGSWLLGGAGVGALLLTVALSTEREPAKPPTNPDPLAELVAKARDEAPPADRVTRDNVTFSEILSDKEAPSTALVAVKDKDGQLSPPPLSSYRAAPPPTDQLPIMPLPAGNLLETTRFSSKPSDQLTELAADRAQPPANAARAEPGSEGQYQLQVASFRTEAEAAEYVEALRLRGHRAYSQAARVPERGVWHRVRIGPFKTKAEANAYKADFERKEGMATFLVDPDKVERREAARKAGSP